MANLLAQFAAAAQRYPDRIAIVNGDGAQVSYAALQDRMTGLAARWQAQGVGPGDRVLLAMGVSSDLYASLAALWSLGATVVLPEPAMGLKGLRHAITVTGVTAFCAAGPYRLLKYALPALWPVRLLSMTAHPGAAAPATVAAEDVALISFTSGTTGRPKAIPRSQSFLAAQQHAIAPLLDSAREERDLVLFPVFALLNLAAGRTTILPNWKLSRLAEVTPDQLSDWIALQNVTRALVPPVIFERLAKVAVPQCCTTIFTGGGPVFPDMIKAVQKTNPALSITCVYGSTEAEPIAHLDATQISADDRQVMADGGGLLVGKPVDDITLRIVQDEVQVAGGHVNAGYLDPADDAANKVPDGARVWHRTGDAGALDDQGRLWLLGRVGTDVTLNGTQTYPFSIEVAARGWPQVRACALMDVDGKAVLAIAGTPHPEWAILAAAQGIDALRHLPDIPMDARHASKVDRAALRRIMDS